MVENSVLGVHSKKLNLPSYTYTFGILGENILFVSTYQYHQYLQDFAMLHALKTVDSEAHQYTRTNDQWAAIRCVLPFEIGFQIKHSQFCSEKDTDNLRT